MGAREKSALFNLLQPWLTGAKVLDAYAGTGALGIEALSRGAACAVFVEHNPRVAQVLRDNLAKVSASDQSGARVEYTHERHIDSLRANSHKTGRDAARANTEPVEVIVSSVAQAAARPDWEEKFDLIIADPPYDDFTVSKETAKRQNQQATNQRGKLATQPHDRQVSGAPIIEEILALRHVLADGGVLALSSPAQLGMLDLPDFECLTWRKYAGAGVGLYRKV